VLSTGATRKLLLKEPDFSISAGAVPPTDSAVEIVRARLGNLGPHCHTTAK
jgi:hypothetical protein